MSDRVATGALFPPSTNTAIRVALFCLLLSVVSALLLGLVYARSPLYTGQNEPVVQPIEFDHRHHVADDGIDCRYCHATVDRAASAGYPSSEVCLNCHAQIWNKSPLLDPIRRSFFTDRPLEWKRVHALPDHVYFNHAIHVNKGVGCVTCHGRVDRMPEVMRVAPLTMGWCLDCHRDPIPNLRPRDRITDLAWQPGDPLATGRAVAAANPVHTRTSCTTCHR
jgi:cytochrome c7-like protein